MQSIRNFFMSLFQDAKLRYLIVGGWNTIFGYFFGVLLFLLLNPYTHLVLIAIIANIISISMSFITYKLFVFRTSGGWLLEYLRCYIVYGFNAVLGIFFLWLMVDINEFNIWLAQGVSIFIVVIFSYFLHKHFTFKSVPS
jgi:putative flippase GtrA